MTGRQLLTDVLRDCGYLGVGDTLENEDAQDALRLLNQWISSLALEGLTVLDYLRTVHTLASSTASYSIGTGGDINIVRPESIPEDGARLIIDTAANPVTEIPIEVLTEQRWRAIPQKTLTSPLVSAIYYDHAWTAGLGRIYPFPIPTVGTTQLVLYTPRALTSFANLVTDYSFPSGYELFLRTNFAKVAAPGFGRSLRQEQIDAAKTANRNIKRANTRIVESRLPPGTPGGPDYGGAGGFDIRTGEYRR